MEDNINMPENNENKVEEVKNTTLLVNNSEEVKIVTPPANNSSETKIVTPTENNLGEIKNTIPLNKNLEETPVTPLENEKDILNQKAESAKHSKATKISIAAAVTTVVATGAVVGGLILTSDNLSKVTYILNNKEVEIQVDKKNTLASIQKPSIDGYDFEGWYADEQLTVKLKDDFKFTSDITIYPKFVPKNCQVEYYANDGTGEVFFQEVVFDGEYKLIRNEFVRENYVFVGWSEDKDAHYTDENIISPNKSATLVTEGFKYYAIWKGETKKITFNTPELLVNGETYTFEKTSCLYGETFTLPAIDGEISNTNDKLTKFAGYLINDEVFNVGDEITITENTIIKINWEERDSILYFNLNLPAGEITDSIVPLSFTTHQDSYIFQHLPTPGELVNYEFVCWNTEIDGSGTDYSVTDSFETTEQSNYLYAIWVGKVRTVNVYNKGEIITTIDTRFGETIELPELNLENYNFIGFNNKPDYTGKIYKGNIVVDFTDSIINLYAEYERKQITVSFNANGGTGLINKFQVNTNETYTFKADEIETQRATIKRKNYILVGWSTNPDLEPNEATFKIEVQEANIVLYAIWLGEERTVNLYSQGEIIDTINTRFGETIELPVLTLENYNFVGFNEKSDFTGSKYKGNIFVGFTDETTNLYAEYKRKQVSVSFNANSGTGTLSRIQLNTNEAYTFTEEEIAAQKLALTKENYILAGWSTNKNLNPSEASFTVEIQEANILLYAIWIGEERTVNVYSQGEIVETINTRFGETIELPTLTLENYNFIGFNDKDDFTGSEYTGNLLVNFEDDVLNLYAKFERKQVAISFESNGGVGSIDTIMLNTNEPYTFNAEEIEAQRTALTKENYILAGWNTDPNIDPEDATFTVEIQEEALVLYAIWIGEERTVNIYSQGEIVETINTRFGETIELPELTLENHTFIGFNDKDDFTGNDYTGSITINFTDETTNLYAEFKRNQITVSFDTNYGDGILNSIQLNTNETYTFTEEEIAAHRLAVTKENYILVGWSTNHNLEPEDASFTVNIQEKNVRLYAIWLGEERTINIYSQGEIIDTINTRFNEIVELPVLTLENHTFVGFNDQPDFSGNAYINYLLATFEDETTNLYANFERNQITVSFDSNGGSGSINTVMLNTNEAYTFSESEIESQKVSLIKQYHTLVGWSTNPDLNPEDASFTVQIAEGNVTLYAIWKRNVSIVSFVADGGSVPADISINQGETFTLTETGFEKEGFLIKNFVYNGQEYNIGDTILIEEENVSIEVVWKEKPIIFNIEGIETVTTTTGDKVAITSLKNGDVFYAPNVPASKNYYDEDGVRYYFAGWSTNPNATTPNIYIGETTITATDSTQNLYGVYMPASEELLYELNSSTDTYSVSYDEDLSKTYSLLVIPNTYNGKKVDTVYSFAYNNNIGRVVIAEGITKIEDYAFNSSGNLKNAVIPSTVTSITGVFAGCSELVGVTLPEGLTNIGENTFTCCTSLTNIIIPDSVINIGASAFSSCCSLTSITIPEGVTSIGDYAFEGCNLTSITLPDSVTSIGEGAFQGCSSLTSITISNSIKSIENYTFRGCDGLTSITIPEGVTSIGEYALGYCSSLTSITIPEGVTSIGDYAFGYCSSLTSITIPSSVTYMDPTAFEGCSDLNITFAEGITSISGTLQGCSSVTSISLPSTLKTIGDSAFAGCYNLDNVIIPNGVTSIGCSAFEGCGSLTNIIIPDSVTIIDSSTFSDCYSLTSITIPESVTTIGSSAFSSCNSLSDITIPESVTGIGSGAFSYCSNLTSVTLPSTLTYIESSTFEGCENLTSITIPESVTYIGSAAFYYCSSLTSINIPEGVTSIGDYAFNCCQNLTSIVIPESVTSIGDGAFAYCTSLTSIVIPESVTFIGDYAFESCSSLTNINIPESVTSIGDYAFEGCENLTSITIPDSVTSIGEGAFQGCSSLTSINIPNSIKSIENYTFRGCDGLTSITIPEGVTSIGEYAFAYCTSLTNITIPSSVTYIDPTAFEGCENLTSFIIAEGATSIADNAFANLTNLTSITISSTVTSIGNYAFDCCYNLTSITLPDSVTSIGEGAFQGCGGLTSITIPNSVKSIENYTFQGCGGLTSITIPEGVTSIGDYAFNCCENLTSITLPDSVTSIGDCAFGYCYSLTSITIPEGVTSIGNYAFDCCENLTSITLPDSVTSIGEGAFYGCSSLTSINIPEGVTSIEGGTFYGCSGLTSITIPEGVTSIGSGAFCDCTSLTSINIPEGVTSIEGGTFYGCSGLTSITIPEGVTYISEEAFSGCSSLTSITLPSTINYVSAYSFYGCSNLETIVVAEENTVYDSRDNCNAIIEKSSNTLVLGCKNTVIPSTVTSIGASAFYNCTGLTGITIPEGVTSIGTYAFSDCKNLTNITLPKSLTEISTDTFEGCSNLESIIVADGNTTFDSRDNCNAIINTETNTLILGCKNTVIPSTVTSIGTSAFYNCSSLTSITIPNSVTTIGNHAFYGCTGLTSITIPEGIKTIGSYAFRGCTGLESITLPSTLTSIETYAFYDCSSLTSITIPNSVTSIGNYAFYGCSKLSSVTLSSSLKTIGSYAFRNCKSLTRISIPAKVTSIGNYAFYGCSKLQSMTFMGTTPPTIYSYSIPSTISKIYVPSSSLSSYRSKFSGKVTSSKIVAST